MRTHICGQQCLVGDLSGSFQCEAHSFPQILTPLCAQPRNHVWGIITAVALLRRLRLWLKHILRALRLRQERETVRTLCAQTCYSVYYSVQSNKRTRLNNIQSTNNFGGGLRPMPPFTESPAYGHPLVCSMHNDCTITTQCTML